MKFTRQTPPLFKWSQINRKLVKDLSLPGHPPMQLIAHATGWSVRNWATPSTFAGAWVRVYPTAVLLSSHDQQKTIRLVDPNETTLRTLLVVSLVISTLCWLITIVTTRRVVQTRREPTQIDPAKER